MGVFLQVDPIEFEGGTLGLSSFVQNDPFGWSDPTGLTPGGSGTAAQEMGASGATTSMVVTTGSVGVVNAAAGIVRALRVQVLGGVNIDTSNAPTPSGCSENVVRSLEAL